MKLAKVVNVNPEAHSVDLVMTDTGMRVNNVQVTSNYLSTNTGLAYLPTPTAPRNEYDIVETGDRDVYAYVGFAGNIPVVVGFKVPEICQMTFEEMGLLVDRHESDWYTTVDKEGNFEASHPSGTYVRIAEDPEHRDLTGADLDGRWKIAKNTGRTVTMRLRVCSGGTPVATMDIKPDGTILITAEKVTIDGDLDVNGTVTVTGGDVVADGKHLKTHIHSAVQSGGGTSGPPV